MLTVFTELITREHVGRSNFKVRAFKKSDYLGCFTALAFFFCKQNPLTQEPGNRQYL